MDFLGAEVTKAYRALLDAICSWERTTSREITVIVISHVADEPVAISTSGKPWRSAEIDDILTAVGLAWKERTAR